MSPVVALFIISLDHGLWLQQFRCTLLHYSVVKNVKQKSAIRKLISTEVWLELKLPLSDQHRPVLLRSLPLFPVAVVKNTHTEEDEEDGGIDNSGEESSEPSGEESDGSEKEETLEEEDTDDSKSEAEDAVQEEAHDSADESKSNSKEDMQQEARARAGDDTSKESDESSTTYDYAAQVTKEDKQEITKKLDSNKMSTPTVDEIRTFMYLQELVFIFAKKEKKEKSTKCTNSFLFHSLGLYQLWFWYIS